MVTTRSAACTAAKTSITAARALRQRRRARTAEQEILGEAEAGPAKPNRRHRRANSTKHNKTSPKPAEDEDHIQADREEPQDDQIVVEPEPSQAAVIPSSGSTIVPANPDDRSLAAPTPPPEPEAPKRWFGQISNVPVPNPPAPIFKAAESLIHFSSGLPNSQPESKPFETIGEEDLSLGDNPGGDEASFSARKQEAIRKAATAVMAHMNGRDVPLADYVSILDGMLADPEMRDRLPPILISEYEKAKNSHYQRASNGGLIEKFINATRRATDVTAKILMSKRTRGDRRTRGPRSRPAPVPTCYHTPGPTPKPVESLPPTPSPPMMADTSYDQTMPQVSPLGTYDYLEDLEDQIPMGSQPLGSRGVLEPQSPCPSSLAFPDPSPSPSPGIFAQPLTEANLHRRAADHSDHQRSREPSAPWEEERSGVMRTSKVFSRSAPYPRRASVDTRASYSSRAPSRSGAINLSGKEVLDESGYSVYSASTGGIVPRQTDAQRMASSMTNKVKRMLQPGTYESECVKTAEGLLARIEREEGAEEASRVRAGFEILNCYELVRNANVDFLAEALLEHVSPHLGQSSSTTNHTRDHLALPAASHQDFQLAFPVASHQDLQIFNHRGASSSSSNALPGFEDFKPPPKQHCVHPLLGEGTIQFVRVFEPIVQNSNRILDSPMLPPPHPS
ncbi:hypothetical protein Pst134EA_028019 [Puccinia striiformis f. sp. tritici]|uniref:hypothetical protein n=1 Tax=Puccinia striiformis f. sp. tritici TaxID=168172 RepID=UPI002007D0EF|nr:hypothetical protein Pst134EA_028019 [Puccinia striiformis f. sp. tritici]KAH9448727.1 hypothetical protein Pst134EA_028019 [Puccinia striiformis f. sp. tritici]